MPVGLRQGLKNVYFAYDERVATSRSFQTNQNVLDFMVGPTGPKA